MFCVFSRPVHSKSKCWMIFLRLASPSITATLVVYVALASDVREPADGTLRTWQFDGGLGWWVANVGHSWWLDIEFGPQQVVNFKKNVFFF